MRKVVLVNRFLAALKKEYGGDSVHVSREGDGILITSFMPPESYGAKGTMVYIEIPEGFGYGVNITNSYILLDRGTIKHHLVPLENIPAIVKRKFNLSVTPSRLRKKEWYWICFYVYGDRLYDENRGISAETGDSTARGYAVDFIEYLSMLKVVLTAIASEDREMLQSLELMNRRREEILTEQQNLVEKVKLARGWRRVTWVHD